MSAEIVLIGTGIVAFVIAVTFYQLFCNKADVEDEEEE